MNEPVEVFVVKGPRRSLTCVSGQPEQ
jgi:hypothetical protein